MDCHLNNSSTQYNNIKISIYKTVTLRKTPSIFSLVTWTVTQIVVDAQAIRNLLEAGMKPMDIAKKLGVSRATVYRYKE
jgi:predicted transcriptional regulator